MMIFKAILFLLYIQVGIGTNFSSVDRFNPNPSLACKSGETLKDSSFVVAHRELPCNTRILVCNTRTSKCVESVVMDRGPYGVTKSQYTSVIDLSLKTAKAIGHNGFEPVVIFSPTQIPNKGPKKKYVRKNS